MIDAMAFDLEAELVALIKREGGYSNDPDDSGGETMYGITAIVARENGYMGTMRDLPVETAKAIYRKRYWTGPRFDQVATLSPAIAIELFDTGVNCGVGKASEFLQLALNAFNMQGTRYPDIQEDGDVGAKTLSALRAFLAWRGMEGERVLVRTLNCLQGARYIDLSQRRSANETFVYGWMLNRVN
jgi:lysozyme family protein